MKTKSPTTNRNHPGTFPLVHPDFHPPTTLVQALAQALLCGILTEDKHDLEFYRWLADSLTDHMTPDEIETAKTTAVETAKVFM